MEESRGVCSALICNVPAGRESSVPLEVSTRWTPPEIQKARDRRLDTVTAATSADIWAFGIMGYELLTGNTAFQPGLPRGTIRRMLHGKAPLPWEDHANSTDLTAELADSELKGIVLSCLARKPAVRPSAAALASTLHKLLAASPESAAPAAAAAAAAARGAAGAAPAGAGGLATEGAASADGGCAVDEPSEFSLSLIHI